MKIHLNAKELFEAFKEWLTYYRKVTCEFDENDGEYIVYWLDDGEFDDLDEFDVIKGAVNTLLSDITDENVKDDYDADWLNKNFRYICTLHSHWFLDAAEYRLTFNKKGSIELDTDKDIQYIG